MKKHVLGALTLFTAIPAVSSAQGLVSDASGGPFGLLLDNIVVFADSVLVPFILGIGFLVFVYGMFQYFIVGGANEDAQTKGKELMIYAVLGFVLIIIFWGVVNLLAESTGLEGDVLRNVPSIY